MTKLKEKIGTSIENLADAVTDAAEKIGAAVDDGRDVLADAGNDVKGVVTIAGAKLGIAARSTVRSAKHEAHDLGAAAKKAGGEVRAGGKRAAANIGGALEGPTEVAKKDPDSRKPD
jgi:hypothetical protein